MKYRILIYLLIASKVYSQEVLKVQPGGEKLRNAYLAMNVESLWIAGNHVNWKTGVPDLPGVRHGVRTHCSAFLAAACNRVGVYILRPPQHGQVLLANAQADWLNSDEAGKMGWVKLNGDDIYQKAQELANQGKIVAAIYKNHNPSDPGNAALVMSANCTRKFIEDEGPEMIMAGTHNFNKIAFIDAFKNHITTLPSKEIEFFMHDVRDD